MLISDADLKKEFKELLKQYPKGMKVFLNSSFKSYKDGRIAGNYSKDATIQTLNILNID